MAHQKKTIWHIDSDKSKRHLKTKNEISSTILEGRVETKENDFEGAKVYLETNLDYLFTNPDESDRHLRNKKTLYVEEYPKLTFESTAFKKINEGNYNVTGNLAMRESDSNIQLKAIAEPGSKTLSNQEKASLDISGT